MPVVRSAHRPREDDIFAPPTEPRSSNGLLVADARTLKTIQALAAIFCTQEEAALVLQVSTSTFNRFLAHEPLAQEAWDRGFSQAKVSLRRKQMKLADVNAGMAIFLGKNYLGQRDEPIQDPRRVAPERNKALTALSSEELRILERAAELYNRTALPS